VASASQRLGGKPFFPYEAAASPLRAHRLSIRAANCNSAAAPSHDCQCEKSPDEIAKLLVQFRSAATPHSASAKAMAAAGVSSNDSIIAARRFLLRLTPILGPLPNRMRMIMRLRYQSNRFCDTLDLSVAAGMPGPLLLEREVYMRTYKTALFGTGFVGRVHLEGLRRLGYVQLYGIGEPQIEKARQLGAEFGVSQQLFNFIWLRTARMLHGEKILVKSSRPTQSHD